MASLQLALFLCSYIPVAMRLFSEDVEMSYEHQLLQRFNVFVIYYWTDAWHHGISIFANGITSE